MSYAVLWSKNNISRAINKYYLKKYEHLIKSKNSKENVLEAGCGEGSITKELLYPMIENNVKKLLAIDRLDGMIELAKKQNKIDKIDFQVANVMDQTQAKLLENQFDRIFALLLCQWIPDTKTMLERFYQMLKPNGQIFATSIVDNFLNPSILRQSRDNKWAKYIPKEGIFANYTENPMQYLKSLSGNVGFKLDLCDREKMMLIAENFTDFLRPIVTMFPNFEKIPPELREDYFQDHLQYCHKTCRYLGEPDKYELYYVTMAFMVTKI